MRHRYQMLFGTGFACFLVYSQFGNLLNPGFGLAEIIQDVIAVASNATYTKDCLESDFHTHGGRKAKEIGWNCVQALPCVQAL